MEMQPYPSLIPLDRCFSPKDAVGNITKYEYDALGNETKITYGDGSSHSKEYDNCGRLAKETDELGAVTTYTYDAADNLVSKSDDSGRTWTYTYDNTGNRLSETNPEGGSYHIYFEPQAGLYLVSCTDGKREEQILYAYDKAGNLTASGYPKASSKNVMPPHRLPAVQGQPLRFATVTPALIKLDMFFSVAYLFSKREAGYLRLEMTDQKLSHSHSHRYNWIVFLMTAGWASDRGCPLQASAFKKFASTISSVFEVAIFCYGNRYSHLHSFGPMAGVIIAVLFRAIVIRQ